MKIACVVLASGKSIRFKSPKTKVMYNVYGAPIIEYTLKNITKYINKNSLYITIPKKISKNETKLISNYTTNELIFGGKSRYDSLKNALEFIKLDKFDYIIIHDGARPFTSSKIFKKIVNLIKQNKYDCIAPCLKIEDTIRENGISINRNSIKSYQTPQAVKYKFFLKAVKNSRKIPTDELGLFEKNKDLRIKLIDGCKSNIKITKLDDINTFKKLIASKSQFANGFDIHRLKKGNYLSLAGLKIKTKYTAIGHSDGDVILHAIIDALLGATQKGDIGKYFPQKPEYHNISSSILLDKIKQIVKFNNIIVDNLDCTIICQKIRLEKYKNDIRKNIALLMKCSVKKINIKAKTSDNIGLIGKSKAVACWLTIKLIKL